MRYLFQGFRLEGPQGRDQRVRLRPATQSDEALSALVPMVVAADPKTSYWVMKASTVIFFRPGLASTRLYPTSRLFARRRMATGLYVCETHES
jgi:hypothetical protein